MAAGSDKSPLSEQGPSEKGKTGQGDEEEEEEQVAHLKTTSMKRGHL